MKDIGGYFGLERLPLGDGVRLSASDHHFASGRQALAHWLARKQVKRLYLPGWICPAVLEATHRTGVEAVPYHLGQDLQPRRLPAPAPDRALLVLNICGLQEELPDLGEWPAHQVIVDDTMDFFRSGRAAVASFNSWRKFLPVPDGATLYAAGLPGPGELVPLVGDDTFLRRRAAEGAEAGHADFQAHEAAISDWPDAAPSQLARDTLARLDAAAIRQRRRVNYRRLHTVLGPRNDLRLPDLPPTAVPLAYPFLPPRSGLHEKLWEQRIWVPRLWGEDRRLRMSTWERRLAVDLLPLPVDHRWDETDMDRVTARVMALTGGTP